MSQDHTTALQAGQQSETPFQKTNKQKNPLPIMPFWSCENKIIHKVIRTIKIKSLKFIHLKWTMDGNMKRTATSITKMPLFFKDIHVIFH